LLSGLFPGASARGGVRWLVMAAIFFSCRGNDLGGTLFVCGATNLGKICGKSAADGEKPSFPPKKLVAFAEKGTAIFRRFPLRGTPCLSPHGC